MRSLLLLSPHLPRIPLGSAAGIHPHTYTYALSVGVNGPQNNPSRGVLNPTRRCGDLFCLALITLAGALILQWAVSPLIFGIPSAIPPLVVLAAAAWLWMLPLMWRLGYAAIAGFVLDSLALPPFGTMLLLFFILALAVSGLKRILASRDSRVAQIAGMMLFYGCMMLGIFILRGAAGFLYTAGL